MAAKPLKMKEKRKPRFSLLRALISQDDLFRASLNKIKEPAVDER